MKRMVFLIMLLTHVFWAISAHASPAVTVEPAAANVPADVVWQLAADYPEAEAIAVIRHYAASPGALTPETYPFSPPLYTPILVLLLALIVWLSIRIARRIMHTAQTTQ